MKRVALAVALVAVGAVGALGVTSGAVGPGSVWTYYSGTFFVTDGSAVAVDMANESASTQNVTYEIRCSTGGGIILSEAIIASNSIDLAPGQHFREGQGIFASSNCPTRLVMVIERANSNQVIPGASYQSSNTNAVVQLPAESFQVVGPSGATNEALVNLHAKADAIAAKADSISAKADSISTGVNANASKLGGGVGPAGTGFNTSAFCAEGSVRKDAAGVLQMYVTLFSETDQTVTINYITNKGTKSKTVPLAAGVRYTDDANAFLTGPEGQFPGASDVDTSVKVSGTAPVFLACPVYFSRSIGEAGLVSGGTVQDGSHN
jgi:hypothetical protein